MGKLAAGVAHEIRNPLNTISIASQRLASEFAPGESSEEYLSMMNQIRSETKRLNNIIGRFLSLAQEEKKRYATIDLSNFITDTVEFFKPEAEKLKLHLSTQVESELRAKVDPDSLKQVFINLFNNSKEAMGGKPGKILIEAQRRGDTTEIAFSDSGPGVNKELREKIFTPFFTTKINGTGLGLPTVYKIISDMGADINVEDSNLGGARFVITIPRQ